MSQPIILNYATRLTEPHRLARLVRWTGLAVTLTALGVAIIRFFIERNEGPRDLAYANLGFAAVALAGFILFLCGLGMQHGNRPCAIIAGLFISLLALISGLSALAALFGTIHAILYHQYEDAIIGIFAFITAAALTLPIAWAAYRTFIPQPLTPPPATKAVQASEPTAQPSKPTLPTIPATPATQSRGLGERH